MTINDFFEKLKTAAGDGARPFELTYTKKIRTYKGEKPICPIAWLCNQLCRTNYELDVYTAADTLGLRYDDAWALALAADGVAAPALAPWDSAKLRERLLEFVS